MVVGKPGLELGVEPRGGVAPLARELIGRLRSACEQCGERGAWLRPSLDEARGDLERLLSCVPPSAFHVRCAIARAHMVLGVWHSVADSAPDGDER